MVLQPSTSTDAARWVETIDGVVQTLRTTRLTVLIDRRGSGATRPLLDSVVQRLRRRIDDLSATVPAPADAGGEAPAERRRRTVRPRELVVFCDRWDGSPAERVHACLDDAVGAGAAPIVPPRLPVALRAKALSAERGARLLFVFDHADPLTDDLSGHGDPAAEYDALVNALCSVSPSVHLLLTARENALPPSVQSRLGSPDTRVVRLSDDGVGEGDGAPAAGAPPSSAVDTGLPLHPEDVYASIADRLGQIAARSSVPPWGSTAARARVARVESPARAGIAGTQALRAAPERIAPSTSSPPTELSSMAAPPDASSAAPAFGTSDALESVAPGRPAPASAPPVFVPGSFTRASAARRSASRRRVRSAVLAVAFLVTAVVGIAWWQDHDRDEFRPEASYQRVGAAAGSSAAAADRSASAPVGSPPATVVATAPHPPGASSSGPYDTDTPALEATTGASGPPQAPSPADPPSRLAGSELGEPLADELWRQMSRHGARAPGDAVDAAGRRLAVVPYDALRTLASTPVAARTARVVAPLFTEEIHVIARADSTLSFIHQIAGRRIEFGPPGSARQQTAVAFYRRLFDRSPTPAETVSADLDAALAELLGGGSIDAIVLPAPQPSAWLAGVPAAQLRRLKLLAAANDDPSTRRALRSYLPATVRTPAGIGGPAVRSFAVMTFLVATSAAPAGLDDTAAVAARALCLSLPELRRSGHPKWREVDPALRLPLPLAYEPVAPACDPRRVELGRRPAVPVPDTALDDDNRPQGVRR